jgi:ubiquinone/menaquinone biosynthesis C-methylase UbiE
MPVTDYEKYLLSQWEQYHAHPDRFRAALGAVAGQHVYHVLDVGCGAGQELLPFVHALGATGVGVDISPQAPHLANGQFAKLGCAKRVRFLCCAAESLPFTDNCFDVITCRLALPYTRNAVALEEMARVLRPGGLLLLKIHHVRFYLGRFWLALRSGCVRLACYNAKVLLAGTLYHITGRQPNYRFLGLEVFQSHWLLGRILSSIGLVIREELQNSDSNPRTPVFVIEKRPALRPSPMKVNMEPAKKNTEDVAGGASKTSHL